MATEVKQPHNLKIKGQYLGIDASLTCTGIALLTENELITFNIKPKTKGAERLNYYNGQFLGLLNADINRACLEGYAYGKTNQSHQIGELGGIIRLRLYYSNIKTVIIPPQSLKKFVTGVGKGDKSGIKLHLYKRWGLTLEQEDQADATGCALVAAALDNDLNLIKPQIEALKKIER